MVSVQYDAPARVQSVSRLPSVASMPVLCDHAEVSDWTLEALARIKALPRKSIDVSQVSADLARLAERSPALNDHLAGLLKFTMMPSDEELEVLAGIKKTRRKEHYRKCAARRLEFERTMWLRPGPRAKTRPEITPERVEHLAAHLLREADRDIAKSIREDQARKALNLDMRPASELPLEPPVALERKALNQLDKRAKTRKLAGPKEAKDDENEHRQHREKKEQQELRNAQTKARKQKRAKARADKLAA